MRRPRFCAEASTWFDVLDLGDGVHLIGEPGHVNSFLIEGRESAILFDSGTGIAPISEVVASLTDRPITVVSSHHHVDHRGGNGDLATSDLTVADFATHPAATDATADCGHDDGDPDFLRTYAMAMTAVVERYREVRAQDDRFFFTLARSAPMRSLPNLDGWTVPAVPPTRLLRHGEHLDLGGRALTVLHTPGHSPDSLVLFEETTGLLFAGDTVLAAAHWLHGPGADVDAFARSTALLTTLPVTRVLVAHNLLAELPPSAVHEVAYAAESLASSSTTPSPASDLLGNPVAEHRCGPVTLLTSPLL